MFGMTWRDQLPPKVADEFEALMASLAGFLSVAHEEDGTLRATEVAGDVTPVGFIAPWPTGTPPSGWIVCDGSAVSRATYRALFLVIGTTYGTGDGVLTFNLPDETGEIIAALFAHYIIFTGVTA